MSANATTAMHGQSTSAGPLGAAAVLTAVVAFGALGFVIGQGVATTTTTAARPVAGPVIDSTSMSGPRSAAQKGLADHQAAIAATKDADASIVLPATTAYSGTNFAGQYEVWLKAQAAAANSDFPDMYQRSLAPVGVPYSGSDFAGQYEVWLKAQAAAASASFPDYFQRHAPAAASLDFPDYFQRHTAPIAGGTGGRSVWIAQ